MPLNPLPPWLAHLFGQGGRATSTPSAPQKVAKQAGQSAAEIRLMRLKAAAARLAEGDPSAALELCATLENHKELESFRMAAALLLAGARGIPEATRCLVPVALSRQESPRMRGAAMLSLANIGGSESAAALERILSSREAEGIVLEIQDLGGRTSLQKFAALLLFDFEGLHGRGILDRLARNPGEYLSPWAEAMAMVFHSDTAKYLQAMLDVLQNHRYPETTRLAVLEAYALLLSNPGMPIDGPGSWWDSLASLALAKQSESPRIREAASIYLSRYRPASPGGRGR